MYWEEQERGEEWRDRGRERERKRGEREREREREREKERGGMVNVDKIKFFPRVQK